MIEILNRKQFRRHFNQMQSGLGNDGSGLWSFEHYVGRRCRWFISVRPIPVAWQTPAGSKNNIDTNDFWQWCYQHCRGAVLCYSSSDQEEWWGFTHHADILLWALRWA